jgi:threonine/homoserine/homoserine lactone efflux protein
VAGATVGAVALGDFTAMTASMLGLGALLATSATLFMLKWIGAAYLIYLGVKLWRAPVSTAKDEPAVEVPPKERPLRIFLHTYIVTALNPKSIIFFVAFLPQFLNATQPMLPQMVIFEATFLILAILNAGFYALMASMARSSIRKPGLQRAVNRIGGSLMICCAHYPAQPPA